LRAQPSGGVKQLNPEREKVIDMSDQRRPQLPDFNQDVAVEDADLAATEVIVDGERLTDERADEIAAEVLAEGSRRNRRG
jgi:hypothetical protein